MALAAELAAQLNDEAANRTAISRAYYATFHAARDYLARAGIPITRSRFAHLQIRDELGKKSETIAQNVKSLQNWRQEADSENPCSFVVAEQASIAVALARSTIEQIKAFT